MATLGACGTEIRTGHGVALGLVVVDRAVALVATFAASTPAPTGNTNARDRLGERQAQTLALLAAGASDSTIARQMGVSQRTVERHVRQIMDTLGVTTRFQAGVHAARRGLL
jgi:DNA-binding NarL/FixJ family response regulator